MKIDSLRDLKQVIALCRKAGVSALKIDNIELQLSPLPVKQRRTSIQEIYSPEANIAVPAFNGYQQPQETPLMDEELTDEQKLFYSAVSHENQQ
jgi:hypothetical protein